MVRVKKNSTKTTEKQMEEIESLLNNFDMTDPKTGVFAIDPHPKGNEDINMSVQQKLQYKEQLKYQPILRQLQANILKGHDRDHVVLVFLRFNTNGTNADKIRQQIKSRIAKFAECCTSAKLQLEEWNLYHYHHIPGGTVANFFLTAKGYAALGFDLERINEELDNKGRRSQKFDENFIAGMFESKDDLNDPDPFAEWDEEYLDKTNQTLQDIHAMISIADDDESELGQKMRILLTDILQTKDHQDLAKIVTVERGQVLRRNVENVQQPVEHFGYVDGISNPIFLTTDSVERVDNLGGSSKWNPWAPLSVVLVKDPLDTDPFGCGSYLAYRKLEQNVKGFTMQNNALAQWLFHPDDDKVSEQEARTAGALVMGRYQNGTPITMVTELGADLEYEVKIANNFNYESDLGDGSAGSRCPLHGHIRKANSREDPTHANRDPQKSSPRIVRRGITYGSRAEGLNEELDKLPPTFGPVGLLFMSFQRRISQFEKIQKTFNNPDPGGCDPIVGQRKPDQLPDDLVWPVPGQVGQSKRFTFQGVMDFVTLRGGEYFFAPSIGFLKNIDKMSADGKVSLRSNGERRQSTKALSKGERSKKKSKPS